MARPSRKSIHERVDREVAALREVGGLPAPEEAAEIWRTIWFHEAHNSTAIEGNTLVLKQVEALLARNETVGNKELKEYLEVMGYADAAKWVYEQARGGKRGGAGRALTMQDVRHIHHLTMSPVWAVAPHPDAASSESPGNFREHDLKPFGRGMRPPTHPLIHARMTEWVAQVNAAPSKGEPVCVRIGRLHAGFERIHPFLDGNGRTGRLVLNLLLVRVGYPPAVIQKRERITYLKALDRADRGDNEPLGELVARAVLDNLLRFLLPAVAGDVKLLPLDALATSDLSVAALRQAAERGRLVARKDPRGTWRSSKKWVLEYRQSRYERLREPRGPRGTAA
jgi:Fic family protein